MIILKKMTETEYIGFYKQNVEELTEVFALKMERDASRRKAETEQKQALPDGVNTKNNYLFSVCLGGKKIGGIWFAKMNSKGIDFAFIFYINIDEEFRGKGSGSVVMNMIDTEIKSAGLDRVRLHVLKNNIAAIKVYKKSGYSLFTDYDEFNPENNGIVMEKKF